MPSPADLADLEQEAQRALKSLVDEAGGRFESHRAIPADHIELLSALFDTWGRRYASPSAHGLYFAGRPGLYEALDQLYPLQDRNRWDRLRAAVIAHLERGGTWRRRSQPRGSGFDIID